jgi:hypothetical protein
MGNFQSRNYSVCIAKVKVKEKNAYLLSCWIRKKDAVAIKFVRVSHTDSNIHCYVLEGSPEDILPLVTKKWFHSMTFYNQTEEARLMDYTHQSIQ